MDEVRTMETATADGVAVGRKSARRRDVWIIVCEDFHGAVGPIPTERLAVGLPAYASEIGGCTYRLVRFALAEQEEWPYRGAGMTDERDRTKRR
jgi:hypothetical protein